jgi:hypothetical protein
MKVSDIVNKVRLCIDEFVETTTTTNADGTTTTTTTGTNDFADTSMDAVIKNSIHSALVWAARNAPLDMLTGTDSPFVKTVTEDKLQGNVLTLGSDFVRLIKVRHSSWKRSVIAPMREDSEEYLMQSDLTALATPENPVAVLVYAAEGYELELYGIDNEANDKSILCFYVTSDVVPTGTGDAESVATSTALEPALIYYTAYLTLIAYGDDRAKSMYEAAMTLLK